MLMLERMMLKRYNINVYIILLFMNTSKSITWWSESVTRLF